jgi:hypothetical protein
MNRRSIFTVATVAALGLALLPSNLNSQQSILKEELVGTWTIVSWEDIAPNGTKRQIANPKGFLIFDSGFCNALHDTRLSKGSQWISD